MSGICWLGLTEAFEAILIENSIHVFAGHICDVPIDYFS